MKRSLLLLLAIASSALSAKTNWDKWAMEYYKHPEPTKINDYLSYCQKENLLSNQNTQAITIGFMSQVMRDNPAMVTDWLKMSEKFSKADRQVLLTAAWYSRVPQATDYFAKSNVNAFAGQTPPDLDNLPIRTGADLDFLWARYFARGNPMPIRRIISALELEKYSGAMEKYKKSQKKTKEEEQAAIYESVFGAAMWSLESNCKQDEDIYTICKEL
jgi:hypothetical protein